jgi:hypothetical protein
MSAQIRWSGTQQIKQGMDSYKARVRAALVAVAQYWGAVFERYAKENAPWNDQTANARQSLHTFIKELSDDSVALYLSHGVSYGQYLESRWSGRLAIVWPTIEAHLSEIAKMLKGIFG